MHPQARSHARTHTHINLSVNQCIRFSIYLYLSLYLSISVRVEDGWAEHPLQKNFQNYNNHRCLCDLISILKKNQRHSNLNLNRLTYVRTASCAFVPLLRQS